MKARQELSLLTEMKVIMMIRLLTTKWFTPPDCNAVRRMRKGERMSL